MPAFISVIFVSCFVVLKGLNGDGVEIVEGAVEGVDDGAGIEGFF